MTTAFISGHLSLTKEEFDTHYKPLIDKAIAEGCSFVVGDAPGADIMAIRYLESHVPKMPVAVTVYHAYANPRFATIFPRFGRFPSQNAKDKAMTEASDFDIAWIRPGKEISGTARNIERRLRAKS